MTGREVAIRAVAEALLAHTRLRPPSGECSCGVSVPLGASFAEHQARAAVDAAAPHLTPTTRTEWGYQMAGTLYPFAVGSEEQARAVAALRPSTTLVRRQVGQWEAADE